jgi:hypothetical protein
MVSINEIFKTFGPEYLARYGQQMPENHRKTINAIVSCRTKDRGLAIYRCRQCGKMHPVFQACGNRHCPGCQHQKSRVWLERQIQRQLPGHHFMVTFTVPDKIRCVIRNHQRVCYGAMFKASSETIKKLADNDKFIGGDLPGFFGVLHTWGRQLQYHPHIHYIVPGGAISKADQTWHPSRIDFLMPLRAMSKIFKAKFRDEMKKAGLFDLIDKSVWQVDWNVNCQAIGDTQRSLKYLAPYVFRVAISNSRIVKVENRRVFFKYRKNGSRRMRTTCLDVMEFMRRFLQHVLPTGFMKVRYYGFLHPGCSIPLAHVAALIEIAYGFDIATPQKDLKTPPSTTCPDCGGDLLYCYSILPFMMGPERYG